MHFSKTISNYRERLIALLICTTFLMSTSQDRTLMFHIPRDQINEAMRLQDGYDITMTPNGTRFQVNVIKHCVDWALQQPEALDKMLFMSHEDYFKAYLETTGLTEENAPQFASVSYQHKQDLLIEHRKEKVIAEIKNGPVPTLALNVKYWWPEEEGGPSKYSYHDKFSTPNLKVTHQRIVTYRMLFFENFVLYDEIEGISGKATSGLLGVLFAVIGEGKAVQSRIAVSDDGVQVAHAKAKKGFIKKNQTVIVYPDGTGEKKIPMDRSDLKTIADQIEVDLDILYLPFNF